MKTLIFKGYSDDTFLECNITNGSIDNCGSCKPIQCVITSEDQSMVVIGQYNRFNNGCWDIGICQTDENMPIPDWYMNFSSEDYTTVLEIEVPDDFSLKWLENGEEF